MALGIFSVTAATNLQNSVAQLSCHRDVRLWLSKGLTLYGRQSKYPEAYQHLPLESSAATVKLAESPTLLLNMAVFTYFLGFGLYLLYGWLYAVAPPASNYRNNFIFYVITVGFVIGYVALFWGKRIMDQDKVNQQFNVKRYFDTKEVGSQNDLLEQWTDVVEALLAAKTEEKRDAARREMEVILRRMRDPVLNDAVQRSVDGSAEDGIENAGKVAA